MRKIVQHPVTIFLLIILISIPLILPYFNKGFFPTHDGEWAVVRLADMFRELRDMQIPARYSGYLNYGYGYPLFNFAYPLPYYIGVIIHALGFSFVDSIKILFALSVPLSGLGIYLASRELWKNTQAGIVSSILYMYYPYRMVDLYVRGSLGESIALTLFPFIIYFILRIVQNPKSYISIITAAILYGALIMTHNIMAVFFTLLLGAIVMSLILVRKGNAAKSFISFMIIGILISCFFWLPALVEKQYIALSLTPIADRNLYYVTLERLLIPSWGYEPPTEANGFSYQLGIIHSLVLGLLIATVAYGFTKSKKIANENYIKIIAGIVLCIVTSIALLFPPSGFIWENLPLLKEINYPWTLLGPIGFLVSLAAGYICLKSIRLKNVAFVLVGISMILVLPYAKPESYINRGDDHYLTNDATTTSSKELMPLWVKQKPNFSTNKKIEPSGSANIENITSSSKKITFTSTNNDEIQVKINTIYYPGWVAEVNGKVQNISYNNPIGVMELILPPGNNNVILTFTETPIRLISDIISLVTIVLLAIVYLITLCKKVISKP